MSRQKRRMSRQLLASARQTGEGCSDRRGCVPAAHPHSPHVMPFYISSDAKQLSSLRSHCTLL